MMPIRTVLLLSAICLADAVAMAAPAVPKELADRITKIVREYYPDAKIVQDDNKFTAKHGTMIFTVHPRLKTGEVLEKTDQYEGPNVEGFLLALSIQEGEYEGAALVPQTLREPYWQTYIDRPMTEDGKGHYVINFSYGSRLDRDFMKALFEVLPKSRDPANPR